MIKLAKFSTHDVEDIREVLREEERPGMSNATKGALWGTLAAPLVGTAIGHHLGRISDDKRKYRIEKLRSALRHNDSEDVRDVLRQDKGEINRVLKGLFWAGIPGAIAGHISQEKKDDRNRLLNRVIDRDRY